MTDSSMTPPGRPTRPWQLRLAVAALALTTSVALAGCGSGSKNEQAVRDDGSVDLSKVTLTIGDQKGGSKALLAAAGDLDHLPYKISWKSFTSGPPLMEALNAGAIDLGGVGNTPPLFAAASKSKIEVVAGATMGAKGDTIVVPQDSSIQSVADLEGKTVAVAEGSSANYNLLAQLARAGLSYRDIKVKALQPADALAAFTNHHVDAWAIWDPYTSQAELEADARVLVDGSGLVNGMTFQAANPDSLKDKATRVALKDYLKRLARAEVWSNTHREEWSKVWSKETGLSPEVTRRAVDRRTARPTPIDSGITSSEQKMADAFVKAGLLPDKFDVGDFFTGDYNDSVPDHQDSVHGGNA
jgi:sulfonate transport system substrate-binding protein